MLRRAILALALGVIAAGVCVWLGLWQLGRLAQRRAQNAVVSARYDAPPASLAGMPVDSADVRYRRVRITGSFDFQNELVLIGRTRQGSPGVNIITPLHADGSARTVLVNRGWVYSPDAATADLARWREPERALVDGYLQEFSPPGQGNPRGAAPNAWRRLDRAAIAAAMPYAVHPYYVVAMDAREAGDGSWEPALTRDSLLRTNDSRRASTPVRLPSPDLSEGPHLNYAVQWFSFATIALVGASVLAWQDYARRRGSSESRTR